MIDFIWIETWEKDILTLGWGYSPFLESSYFPFRVELLSRRRNRVSEILQKISDNLPYFYFSLTTATARSLHPELLRPLTREKKNKRKIPRVLSLSIYAKCNANECFFPMITDTDALELSPCHGQRLLFCFSTKMKKQTLNWLQNAFSISPSSSNRSRSDDSLMSGIHPSKSALASRNRKGSNRQLTRARKLRHLGEKDIQLRRSPASREISSVGSSALSAAPSPVPLPMPELQLLLRQDSRLTSQSSPSFNVPLPSPINAYHNSRFSLSAEDEKEREGSAGSNADANTDGIPSGRLILEYITWSFCSHVLANCCVMFLETKFIPICFPSRISFFICFSSTLSLRKKYL